MKTLTSLRLLAAAGLVFALTGVTASAAIIVDTERKTDADPDGDGFLDFDTIPTNVTGDLADGIVPVIIGSLQSGSSAANLTNGPAQTSDSGNIAESTTPLNGENTRFVIDLGAIHSIARVNSYSRHDGNRAAHRYSLFVATGDELGFDAAPALGIDPTTVGWTLLAEPNTYPLGPLNTNAQHGVSIYDDAGSLGDYRYFLFVTDTVAEATNARSNYGEIDIIAIPEPTSMALVALGGVLILRRGRANAAL